MKAAEVMIADVVAVHPDAIVQEVPCWSSWKAAMCAIQAMVERDQPSCDRLEMPAMKPLSLILDRRIA